MEVSSIQGCPYGGVPLYMISQMKLYTVIWDRVESKIAIGSECPVSDQFNVTSSIAHVYTYQQVQVCMSLPPPCTHIAL